MLPRRVAARAGLLFGAIEIVWGLVFRLGGFAIDSLAAWIFYLLMPVTAVWAVRDWRARGGRAASRPRFATAAWASAYAAGLYSVYVALYNRFVDDSLLVTVRGLQLPQLRERFPDPQGYERALAQLEFQLIPEVFAFSVFLRLALVGVVAGLFVAAAWKGELRR